MQAISQYHRPSTLDEAVGLLGRGDVNTLVIGGGYGCQRKQSDGSHRSC